MPKLNVCMCVRMRVYLCVSDIGADSDLIAMIRGDYSTAQNVLRALDTISAHEVAVAVNAAAESMEGRIGCLSASERAALLDTLETREESARRARLEAAFDDDRGMDSMPDVMAAAEEFTPGI
jgi:hypothetical protein